MSVPFHIVRPTPQPQSIYGDLLNHGFGISYETLVADQHLAAALRHNRQEQPLIARSLDLVTLCVCGARSILEPVLLRRDAEDREQTAATLVAIRRLHIARAESRASNGLIDAARRFGFGGPDGSDAA